jgi:hypothetical protein
MPTTSASGVARRQTLKHASGALPLTLRRSDGQDVARPTGYGRWVSRASTRLECWM